MIVMTNSAREVVLPQILAVELTDDLSMVTLTVYTILKLYTIFVVKICSCHL